MSAGVPGRGRRGSTRAMAIGAKGPEEDARSGRELVAVVPGHPGAWLRGDLIVVGDELGEIVEGVDLGEFGGVDEAQEEVADAGAVLGLEEEGIAAMEDGLLQASFAKAMPRPGLCRVASQGGRVSWVEVPENAA